MKSFIRHMPNSKKLKELRVYYGYGSIDREFIHVRKKFFAEKCKLHCKNYGKKLSCPPYSPHFNAIAGDYKKMFIFWFGYNPQEYVGYYWKSMNKSIAFMAKRVARTFNAPYLNNSSCNKCLRCVAKTGIGKCKGVEYSLESVGIDCDDIFLKLFGRRLQWLGGEKPATLIVGMSGVLYNNKEDEQRFISNLESQVEINKEA